LGKTAEKHIQLEFGGSTVNFFLHHGPQRIAGQPLPPAFNAAVGASMLH
jgi:hypothetical protein